MNKHSFYQKIAVLPDQISRMGGTRTFLLKLLDIHINHNINTTLVIQSGQLDNVLSDLCKKNNFPVFLIPKRNKLFQVPCVSLIYDIYIYFLLIFKVKPALLFLSVGTPRMFSGFFLFNTPLIYFLHTYPAPSGLRGCIMDMITKYFSGRNKRAATVSKYSKNKINEYMHINMKNIEVVYNSIKLMHKKITACAAKQKIVLTVGHIVEYKNPYVWYEVAKKVIDIMPDTIFCWVGEGPLLKTMRNKVLNDKLEGSILFIGFSDNVDSYYQNAAVYFQPSLIESHGIAIIEAMSHGLPCIGSNIGGIPESIENGISGYLINSEDIEGFTKAICNILENKNLAGKMSFWGKEIVKNKFMTTTYEKNILRLYDIIFTNHT